jgi:hypothetical protein
MNNRVDNKVPLVIGVQYYFVFLLIERLLTNVHTLTIKFVLRTLPPCLYITVVVVVVAL